MADRILPEARNPQLEEANSPMYENLVERRCLGQTELKVKPGQVGTTNATKPDNLGVLDYAHLRVPLPKDLNTSGIFVKQANRKWPEAYFLMRRSSDGFISATGMFKAAFPWAQQEEEAAEKEYIKSLDKTSNEEVAGNVWIHPDQALVLADEYGIRRWIEALLDPEPITHGTSDNKKAIKSPPTYRTKDMANGTKASAKKGGGRKSVRGASKEPPESPTKKTPGRKIATPRKPRKSRGKSAEPDAILNGDLAKVEVQTETKPSLTDLPLPEDTSGMLEKAKEMVKEVSDMASTTVTKGKRKAKEMLDDEEAPASPGPDSKRQRITSLDLRRERMKRRALTGIGVSLAIGAIVPSIMAAFGS